MAEITACTMAALPNCDFIFASLHRKKCQSIRFGKRPPAPTGKLGRDCHAGVCARRRRAIECAPLSARRPRRLRLTTQSLFAFAFDRVEHVPVRTDGFEQHVEAPQPRDVLEHLAGLVVQRPPQVLVMPQRQ